MRQWNIKKIQKQLVQDQAIFGFSLVFAVKRKWWNPMRLLFGNFKLERIAPNEYLRELPGARHM